VSFNTPNNQIKPNSGNDSDYFIMLLALILIRSSYQPLCVCVCVDCHKKMADRI